MFVSILGFPITLPNLLFAQAIHLRKALIHRPVNITDSTSLYLKEVSPICYYLHDWLEFS